MAVSQQQKPLLIAEVGQAHDGSLGIAHAYIDAAVDAGADVVKFQMHIASEESTLDERFRVNFSYQDATRFDYWRRMEFTEAEWLTLKTHAEQRGLQFLCSVFSVAAVQRLQRLQVTAYKVGSGEIQSTDLLAALLETGKPLLISTGMSNYTEIDDLVKQLELVKADYLLMQCTSAYPVPLTEVGMNVITEFKQRYPCQIGFSDHSGSIYPSLFAMTQGVAAVEVHVVFDKAMFGPDVKASLTFAELKTLAEARDAFHTMQTSPVDKDNMASSLASMRSLFNKSVALSVDLPAGTLLDANMLTLKKPGTGIPPGHMSDIFGRRLKHAVTADRLLKIEDLE